MEEKKPNEIEVNSPTIVKVAGQKSELEITKEKLAIAKLTLETALAFIIHDNLRKLVESTLKEINSK
jgi:hypothetical protein